MTFLQEAIAEAEAPKESAAEIIRKKFKRLTISQETKELVSDLSLSSEEMNDERTKYILGYKEPGKNLQGTREESPRNQGRISKEPGKNLEARMLKA